MAIFKNPKVIKEFNPNDEIFSDEEVLLKLIEADHLNFELFPIFIIDVLFLLHIFGQN